MDGSTTYEIPTMNSNTVKALKIAEAIIEKALEIDEEVAEPPNPKTAFPGEVVSAKFITKLLENGHYSVVERERLYKLLDEQTLSVSGIIKEEDTPRLGEMLGVDAFIFGSGSYSVDDKGGWYPRKSDNIILKGQLSHGCTKIMQFLYLSPYFLLHCIFPFLCYQKFLLKVLQL